MSGLTDPNPKLLFAYRFGLLMPATPPWTLLPIPLRPVPVAPKFILDYAAVLRDNFRKPDVWF